jgi:hypothetical protein
MATLHPPTSNRNPFADQVGDKLPPAGTYVATLLDVRDDFGVMRPKYQSDQTETVDLTCFLFGFRDMHNQPHYIASRQMKISGNEKSTLFKFLKSLMGKAPSYNWDYCQLKGTKCLLTVEHIQRRDGSGVFAGISSLSPLPADYVGNRPPLQPQPAPAPQPPPTAATQEEEIPF